MLNSEFIKDKFFERAEGTKAKLAEKCPDCVVTVEDLADKAKLEKKLKLVIFLSIQRLWE